MADEENVTDVINIENKIIKMITKIIGNREIPYY